MDVFYKNFYYPKTKKLKPFDLTKRRIQQFLQILFSKQYQTTESICEGVTEHYSHAKEIHFYESYSHFGFHENELEATPTLIKDLKNKSPQALVVGCGAGREVFALKKLCCFSKLTGIDVSLKMIDSANKLNRDSDIQFFNLKLEKIQKTYDLIWVTAILESHIQGQDNRIRFFKNIYNCLKEDGHTVFTPLIRPLHWKTLYFWGSQVLRFRWMIQSKWEEGDALVANLGAHHQNDKPVYCHFYPTKEHFKTELKAAGFNNSRELPQGTWVIKK